MSILLPLLVLLAGCASPIAAQRDQRELSRLLGQADHLGARDCSDRDVVRDYALAQAQQTFAGIEFQEGDLRRAQDHLDLGLLHARRAVERGRACVPPDTDGDGIADADDRCPDQPEDFDGVADDDGCPEEDVVLAPVAPTPVRAAPEPTRADADGDGIADSADLCPASPEDIDDFQDQDGCPDPDNDGDTVPDELDQCPLAAEDRDGFQDQDGCPDLDNDGDGLTDQHDACPDEPGPGDGCPPRDRDADGIVDAQDRCPDEAENFNDYLDADGCPDVKPQKVHIAHRQIVIEDQINFQTGKAVILPGSHGILDSVVQVLRDYPAIHVRIEGHTDNVGSDQLNMRLSKARADSVFEYIIGEGIDPRRLETVGYGETRPIDTNRTAAGRANNRRVEFHITEGLDGD